MLDTGTPTQGDRIRELVDAERSRLLRESGIEQGRQPFRRPEERPFTARQRARTTLLFGGLTLKHEALIKGALEGFGYRCESLPAPDVRAFQLGKEYGNNGQCNPTYFTVGNLVKHLQGLRDSGLGKREILEKYVFMTAGACGPCRFGTHEAEYLLALRNSGFDGFRVILIQQKGGLTQSDVEAGLRMDLDFFLGVVGAISIGDLLNEIGNQIRPYEIEEGSTDRALDRCTAILQEAMRKRRYFSLAKSRWRFLKFWPWVARKADAWTKLAGEIFGHPYRTALVEARRILETVPVDRTRVRPLVKITGEFWAQTTEGDGNFNMFRFLEREGAEVLVEPVATWLLYMLWQVKAAYKDRFGLKGHRNPVRHFYRLWRLGLAERAFTKVYNRRRDDLGGTTHAPVGQLQMQRLGHPYYHSRSQGGEGHLEVAKNIHYFNAKLCHMVLSLKPFGCMPSTQSDGVQAAVVSHHPDMIYLPIETSGEGEINAHSRVQMALGEARRKAREEFERALAATGRPIDELKEYAASRPELCGALATIPHDKRYAGSAANFVSFVAKRMEKDS
ncbi:MAG: activator of (R)-2-hydroxyglutaryl-CoA dehydratase [Planctomycetota bacterium]|jgi:predicted nucleotide-binding protein (sugar kinase/HSP70/actin superfamily)